MSIDLLNIWKGFTVGIGLIMVIGSQNAFILRQGIKQEHVFLIASICALADAFLILFGVTGVGSIINSSSTLKKIMVIGGSAFLIIYGSLSFKNAVQGTILTTTHFKSKHRPKTYKKIILLALSFSLLNPHAWLDAVVILGSIAGQYSHHDGRYNFAIGAILASFVWFYSFAFIAKRLSPYLQTKIAWRIINFSVAFLLWYIAFVLISQHFLKTRFI